MKYLQLLKSYLGAVPITIEGLSESGITDFPEEYLAVVSVTFSRLSRDGTFNGSRVLDIENESAGFAA